MTQRQQQVGAMITRMAAEFFARESNGTSLITVTTANISPDLKNAMLFISVLPETHEKAALDFAKRARPDFRDYLKSHARLKSLPFIDFELDYGEKNRQRVDDLTR